MNSESVLQKLAEEISLYVSANQDVGYIPSPIRLRVEIREMLRSALEPMLTELHARVVNAEETTRAFKESNIKLYAEAAEQALREAREEIEEDRRADIAMHKIVENKKDEIEKLRELLRQAAKFTKWIAERPSPQEGRMWSSSEAADLTSRIDQALSPSPTPAPDTNTQSLCRAKPSPDSATPTSSSSVDLPSLPPDDAAVHNARQGVISALPGTADRSKALDELVRAEMEDGTYWRIPCRCSESERSQCKLCGGKGWIDARAARGKGEQG
jgi:hypothetical protein